MAAASTSACSSSETPESEPTQVDPANVPVPPADGPPLVALRTGVIVRDTPSAAGKPLGTLGVGARVPRSAEAVTTDGCPGGWYAVRPRGFVCAGVEALTDVDAEAVKLVGQGPNLGEPMPYRYARVLDGAAVTYGSIPSREEQLAAEPKLGSLKKRPPERVGAGSNDVPQDDDLRPTGVPVVMPDGEGVGADGYRTTESWFQFGSHPSVTDATAIITGDPNSQPTRVLKRRSGLALLGVVTGGEGDAARDFGVTPNGRFIPIDRLEPDVGSTWFGFNRAELDLPVAFALRRGVRGWSLDKTSKATQTDDELEPGEPVNLSGRFRTVNSVKFFETNDGFWVRHKDLIVIYPRNQWPDWATAGQKWLDISLANQTMVAYQGHKPLLATLISSGEDRLGDPQSGPSTVQGVFRLRSKHITAPVDDREVQQAFSLDDVPWVLEFAEGFSITGCYWRPYFGEARSFHNVALSSVDAHWLWHFTDPELPDGWHSIQIDEDASDNTIVYVHK